MQSFFGSPDSVCLQVYVTLRRGASAGLLSKSVGYLPERRCASIPLLRARTHSHTNTGVVFLFRIGLALVTCCRRALRDMRSESDALSLLTRPPPFLLSSSPSALIELCSSFRIKDDDVRKQRVKLEAQVKRQTQSRLSNAVRRSSHASRGGGGLAVASITLPTKS